MPSESISPRPDRVGGSTSSVRLTVEVPTPGARRVVPSTLVVGVLAELSGQPEPALPPLSRRGFIAIDRDNFDDVLTKSQPRLAFQVDDLIRGGGSRIDVVLRFHTLDDFEPEHIVRQIGPLKPLLDARGRLVDLEQRAGSSDQVAAVLQELRANIGQASLDSGSGRDAPGPAEGLYQGSEPDQGAGAPSILEQVLGLQAGTLPQAPGEEPPGSAGRLLEDFLGRAMAGMRTVSRDTQDRISGGVTQIDDLLSKQLSPVLQHPSFQRLEAAWRGLHALVFNSETGETLKIKALNLSKPELLQDIEQAGASGQTELFRKLDRAAENGEPFGVLLGDYDFANEPADVAALEAISQIATAAHAPFLAAVAPAFFGLPDFAELADVADLVPRLESAEYQRWREFRSSDSSRSVGLCLPSILVRLPYGRETRSVELFEFEEDLRTAGQRAYLWGNPVFALGRCLTSAFASEGSCQNIQGFETGGKVRRLAVHIARADDEPVITGPTAVTLSQRRASELVHLGFIPLVSIRGTDEAAFLAVVSCRQPQEPIRISSSRQ
jgi:type VI secretion system protein ImpC